MTPQEFANKIRQKYPGAYDNVDDVTLSQKVIEKYPVYANQVQFGTTETTQPGQVTEQPGQPAKKGFFTRVKEDITKRGGEFAETLQRQGKGEQLFTQSVLQLTGQTLGGALDVATEALVSAGRGLSNITPDFIEKPAIKMISEAVKTNPNLQNAAKLLQNLQTEFENLKQRDPAAAADLSAVGNIVGFLTMAVGGKPVAQAGTEFIKETAIAGTKAFETAISASKTKLEKGLGLLGESATQMARELEESTLRLTPVQKQNLGKKIDDVIDFTSKNNIVGNPAQRFTKASNIVEQNEVKLQTFLSETAKGRTVPREQLLADLEKLKGTYATERDVLAIENQIESIKTTLLARYPDQIPVDILNELKRSTYKNAYNKAGEKVADWVEHDAGDLFRQSIENATKGLKLNGVEVGVFNKEYGKSIVAKKLLKVATSRAQVGTSGKIISGVVGGIVGSWPGVILGPQIGKLVLGTAAKTKGAQLLRKAGEKIAKTKIKSPPIGLTMENVNKDLIARIKNEAKKLRELNLPDPGQQLDDIARRMDAGEELLPEDMQVLTNRGIKF